MEVPMCVCVHAKWLKGGMDVGEANFQMDSETCKRFCGKFGNEPKDNWLTVHANREKGVWPWEWPATHNMIHITWPTTNAPPTFLDEKCQIVDKDYWWLQHLLFIRELKITGFRQLVNHPTYLEDCLLDHIYANKTHTKKPFMMHLEVYMMPKECNMFSCNRQLCISFC